MRLRAGRTTAEMMCDACSMISDGWQHLFVISTWNALVINVHLGANDSPRTIFKVFVGTGKSIIAVGTVASSISATVTTASFDTTTGKRH